MFRPFIILTAAAMVCCHTAGAAERVDVQAAASLTDVMNTLVERYEQHHDVDIVPVYASSSTLARQISQGAPADIYLSANEKWMDWLEAQGEPIQARHDLLNNRLALITSEQSGIEDFTPDADHPLVQYLKGNDRIAVGDPDHVPAGIYARQAFEHLGQWQALEPRLARASDVRGALALVSRGETPLGVVYATDAMAGEHVHQLGLFPASSHDPITYPAALVGKDPSPQARAFLQWLGSEEAASTFKQYGFEMNGSSDAP
ncbi:molybdate ABC transporter substrate-binding protein [Kushneria marisflavi]|uniref:Molybdate ABC transporter substrate-binding protein n=1 Tax=Kushneria marisflavi TaxID=157779 RepID=A0A240ULJ6_9GAMM|nr:molybdate ABC transporter substrate-binding protein [Kushneria marisflavi]ART62348.1 molybdate ABC transporter substrate-binding protein [Kushneria marisflavi]RKD87456.1 molybdate transport system substrate-binding protein [Kushneria marisflavi]